MTISQLISAIISWGNQKYIIILKFIHSLSRLISRIVSCKLKRFIQTHLRLAYQLMITDICLDYETDQNSFV